MSTHRINFTITDCTLPHPGLLRYATEMIQHPGHALEAPFNQMLYGILPLKTATAVEGEAWLGWWSLDVSFLPNKWDQGACLFGDSECE